MQLWNVSLLGLGETTSDARGCDQITPEIIGVTATPVIDRAAGTNGVIYVVAMSKSGSNYFQRLHALDVTNGTELFGGPKTIQATFPGTGDNSSNGNVSLCIHDFFGTFAPFFRASDNPIAMACLRLFTLPPFPALPDFNVPFFFRCIALFTVLLAAFPYLRGIQYLLRLALSWILWPDQHRP